MRCWPQYPFDPQAVEDFFAFVLEGLAPILARPTSRPFFMGRLMIGDF
jgi:hypothetical protein